MAVERTPGAVVLSDVLDGVRVYVVARVDGSVTIGVGERRFDISEAEGAVFRRLHAEGDAYFRRAFGKKE